RSERELARHRVDGVQIEKRGDRERPLESAHQGLGIVITRLDVEVGRTDAAGRRVRAPPCVPGRWAAHFPRGPEVREIAAQHAVLDEDPRRCGDALAFEWRPAESDLPP